MMRTLPTLTPRLVLDHLQRWRRARRLGVSFLRRGTFRLPSEIRVNGKMITLDLLYQPGTRDDFISIFLSNMYMIENLSGIHSILDIGGNQGLFSVYARSLHPDAAIHVYEPNPAMQKHLKTNCSPLNIDIFEEGVAARDGVCALQLTEEANQTRIVTTEGGDVAVTSIARAIDRMGGSVDLLKLDCEGFEWDILTDRDSLRRVRWLAMEYHLWANGGRHDDLSPFLQRLGFDVVQQARDTDFGQVLARRGDVA